jgi:hypothetical protein
MEMQVVELEHGVRLVTGQEPQGEVVIRGKDLFATDHTSTMTWASSGSDLLASSERFYGERISVEASTMECRIAESVESVAPVCHERCERHGVLARLEWLPAD